MATWQELRNADDHNNWCAECGTKIFHKGPLCVDCEAEFNNRLKDTDPEPDKDVQDVVDLQGHVPTQEDEESMQQDMLDPALFGELAIPPDHEVEERINGTGYEYPEDYAF